MTKVSVRTSTGNIQFKSILIKFKQLGSKSLIQGHKERIISSRAEIKGVITHTLAAKII